MKLVFLVLAVCLFCSKCGDTAQQPLGVSVANGPPCIGRGGACSAGREMMCCGDLKCEYDPTGWSCEDWE